METYLNNLTDQELLQLVDENYYSIGVTGAEALTALVNDTADGVWEKMHGVPAERMKRVIVLFIDLLTERNDWNAEAGVNLASGEGRRIRKNVRRKFYMRGRR